MASDFSKESKSSNYSFNSGYGYEYEDNETEVWVADFGSHDIEATLKEEVAKIKPRGPKAISWIITTILLALLITFVEQMFQSLARQMFWSEFSIFWLTWILRAALLTLWLIIARGRWLVEWRKLMVISYLSFLIAVIISDIEKIVTIGTAWVWLNILVDPIWTLAMVSLISFIYYKLTSAKGGSASGGNK